VVGDFGDGHYALVLGPDIDHQVLAGDDADHSPVDHAILVLRSFRLFLFECLECGCEIFRHFRFFTFRSARAGRLLGGMSAVGPRYWLSLARGLLMLGFRGRGCVRRFGVLRRGLYARFRAGLFRSV
jgi:hypothetical protein